MSWSISVRERAKHLPGAYAKEVERVRFGRNGFEQTAIDATQPLVEAALKHAALTDMEANASASGHHAEDGTGEVHVNIKIHKSAVELGEPGQASLGDRRRSLRSESNQGAKDPKADPTLKEFQNAAESDAETRQ